MVRVSDLVVTRMKKKKRVSFSEVESKPLSCYHATWPPLASQMKNISSDENIQISSFHYNDYVNQKISI